MLLKFILSNDAFTSLYVLCKIVILDWACLDLSQKRKNICRENSKISTLFQ